MSRRRKWEQEEAPPVRPGFWARCRYLLLVVLTLLIILYVAAQAMARTAGFRDLVGQRLEARLGLPVKIEQSSVNWRFDLTLINLVTEGTTRPDSPGLRARRIHLAWSFRDWWKHGVGLRAAELDRCVVVFRRDEQGGWAPREFQPLSDVLGQWLEFDLNPKGPDSVATRSTASTSDDNKEEKPADWRARMQATRTRVSLQHSDVTWWDGGDQPRAAVHGVGVQVTPVEVPGREVTHLKLEVAEASAQRGDKVRNLRVEVLDLGSQQMVLGLEAERQQAERRATPHP